MGTRPSLRPVYDDHGNQIGVIESGPTESQLKKGKIPTGYKRPESITINTEPPKKRESTKKSRFAKRR